MTENKVVIKINYDKSKASQLEAQPKMVTEWHYGRIALTLTILLIMSVLLTYFLMGSEHTESVSITKSLEKKSRELITIRPEHDALSIQDKSVVNENMIEKDEETEIVKEGRNIQGNPISEKTLETKASHNQQLNKIENKTRQKPIILDKRVSRVVLAKALNNKEPAGEITLPVVVNRNKAIGVFFFTEINNMKGEVLFHHWYRNDKSVFKKRINILGNRWRATTSKLLTYSQKGHWVAKLIDADGNVLSKIQFDVI